MAIEVKAPPYRIFNIAPAIKPGAMEKSKSFLANDKIQADLGFPGQEVADWHDRAIGKMGELLGKYRSLKVYMDACVHCGACSDKCHYFIGTGDPKNMPVARQDLMRSVYRRYFTLPGKLFPKLVGARNLTREVMDEWYNYFHQCSECRRCSVFCPRCFRWNTLSRQPGGRKKIAQRFIAGREAVPVKVPPGRQN